MIFLSDIQVWFLHFDMRIDMKDIVIRKVNSSDSREEISNVYEQSWKFAYKGIISQDYLDSVPSDQWCGALDNFDRYNLIMLDGDKIIGTSSYCKSRFEDYKDWGEIISIYFLPEYMGKGYGRCLLEQAVEALKAMGFKRIFLWVLEDNHRARHFYEKYGFENSGEYIENVIGGKQLRELQYVYFITEKVGKDSIMAFDYKKEYKEFYMPKKKPSIVEIPKMNYIAVRGKGNPNDENSEYKNSIGLLYAIAFTIKMSYKGSHKIDGYFEYVVPPLEGFWWQENTHGIDYNRKEDMNFISVIRLPDFVTEDDFRWAVDEATAKKKQDFSKVEFLTYDEGVCVQCMHIGSYDNEPETVDLMHKYMEENDYELDITDNRLHHEIYLSDPRRCDESKLKTVIRHPIKKKKMEN